jgi:hypothetical protein
MPCSVRGTFTSSEYILLLAVGYIPYTDSLEDFILQQDNARNCMSAQTITFFSVLA